MRLSKEDFEFLKCRGYNCEPIQPICCTIIIIVNATYAAISTMITQIKNLDVIKSTCLLRDETENKPAPAKRVCFDYLAQTQKNRAIYLCISLSECLLSTHDAVRKWHQVYRPDHIGYRVYTG